MNGSTLLVEKISFKNRLRLVYCVHSHCASSSAFVVVGVCGGRGGLQYLTYLWWNILSISALCVSISSVLNSVGKLGSNSILTVKG